MTTPDDRARPTALVVTLDMGGNLPPMLGIGAELAARGWRVVVHADAAGVAAAQAARLETVPAAGVAYDPAEPRSAMQAMRDLPRLWADRSRGRDAVAEARRIGADVAVVDILLLGALAELEAAGVPTVVVAHSSWDGFATILGGPMGALIALRGAPPRRVVSAADRLLVTSHRSLGRDVAIPAHGEVVGAVLQEVPAPARRDGTPLVLVSLSSVAFPGQREALQHVLTAVAELPVEVEAAHGRAVDPAGLRMGANTTLHPRLDHAALMPRAALVVSHGGHATTVRALAHGVPLLVIPMHPMMDQPRIGAAVAEAGAGLVVKKSSTPETIRAAATRLLEEPSFRERARALGASMVDQHGRARAADVVESLVRERAAA